MEQRCGQTTSVLGSRKVDRLVVDRKGLEMVRQSVSTTPGVPGPTFPVANRFSIYRTVRVVIDLQRYAVGFEIDIEFADQPSDGKTIRFIGKERPLKK
jgi:hypothetical protein